MTNFHLRLDVHPQKQDGNQEEGETPPGIGVYLSFESGEMPVSVEFKVKVEEYPSKPNNSLKKVFNDENYRTWGWRTFLNLLECTKLPTNTLTLVAEVSVHAKMKDEMKTIKTKVSTDTVVRKINGFTVVLPSSKDKIFSDFIVESESGEEIECHRLMLATQSKVLRAMFETDMKEANENRLKLDFNTEVLQHFVDFFYDHEVRGDILLKYPGDFLNLSEKYDLPLLKLLTEHVLVRNLSTENMIEFYMLGDLYNAEEAKDAAKKFLINNKGCLKDKEFISQLKGFDMDKIVDIMQIIL